MNIIRPFQSLEACFGDMRDSRVEGRCEHMLREIIMVAVCAVLSGAESWSEVEQFGESKLEWLKGYLELPAGIPSHDTFGRVFRLLDAEAFQERFMQWVEATFAVERGQVIAVDVKTVLGSRDSYARTDRVSFQILASYEGWAGLHSIGVVYRERRLPNLPQTETDYFLSSLPADAQRILDATRVHWSVENTFHWTLDVTFAEDASRVRLDNAPENFAVLRHLAFNLLKSHPYKAILKRKRYRAALDDSFLFDLLTQF